MGQYTEQDAQHRQAVAAYYESGNEAPLAAMLTQMRPRLLRFVGGTLNVYNEDVAADLVQESLAAVLTALRAKQYAPKLGTAVAAWACGITRMRWLRMLHRSEPSKPSSDDDPLRHLADLGTSPELLPDAAESQAEAQALLVEATRAVLGLDDAARRAVALHFYEGLPVPEAAQRLGLTVPTFRARLGRGLASLKEWAAGQAAPTADTYAALRGLDTGDLFTDYGLRPAA
jgi:RNA polymerase sigma factor (sigma-70 family)